MASLTGSGDNRKVKPTPISLVVDTMCDYDANKLSASEEGNGREEDEQSENVEKNSLDEMNEHVSWFKYSNISHIILLYWQVENVHSRVNKFEHLITVECLSVFLFLFYFFIKLFCV